ncbi:MFS transporter [Nonomuraea jabiensis]|uniref:MFS family permease n=1 Tax=Nonomuraea jabiensis TaxID=882448 RepID=A0A7W9L927_9ACTN|nr:MFS transporter [Nonomuraea jabiensis]MBB5775152.1 MFS family permease [Nonomuraea jabiensis]
MPVQIPHRTTMRLLIAAAFTTALGNNVQLITGALLLAREQQTMMAVGWLFIAVALPQAVLSPYLGRLADRLDRRALWIACDTVSGIVALGLPLWLAAGGAAEAGIYAANFALALVSAIFVPASAALIKERVPGGAVLRRFNGRYEMATQAGMLLSATVGGLAVQLFGAVPLLVFNAATFAVSALCVTATGRTRAAGGLAAEPVEAAGPDRPPLPMGSLILLYAQGSVVVTVFNALLPTYVLIELDRGAGTFGAIDALGSLGFLAAAAGYRLFAQRYSDLRIAVVGFLACSLLIVAQGRLGVAGLAVLVPLGAFVFGQARISSRNLLMARAGRTDIGRVFGLANGGGLAATIVVMLLVAAVTDHTSAGVGFAALGAFALLSTAWALVLQRRAARGTRSALPSAKKSLRNGAVL